VTNYELEHDSRYGEPDRVVLTLEGRLGEELADEAVEELRSVLDSLSGDFYFVNDISEFKPLSQDAAAAIERGKQALAEHDVNAVVRVTGESNLGKMQFDRVGEQDYQVATAETKTDAEELLEEF
jgi:hypothetical protein